VAIAPPALTPAVAPHPDVGLLAVAGEAFQRAQPRAVFADHRGGLVGQHLLVGAGLEELADPQAAGVAPGLRVGSVWLVPITLSP
jgi:hypothetical protein